MPDLKKGEINTIKICAYRIFFIESKDKNPTANFDIFCRSVVGCCFSVAYARQSLSVGICDLNSETDLFPCFLLD